MTHWEPGDEANGYRLSDSGRWEPIAKATPDSLAADGGNRAWQLGDVANGYVLTTKGWIPIAGANLPASSGRAGQPRRHPAETPAHYLATPTPQRSSWLGRLPNWSLVAAVATLALIVAIANWPQGPATAASPAVETTTPAPTTPAEAPSEAPTKAAVPLTAEESQEIECIQWNASWHRVIEKTRRTDKDLGDEIFAALDEQPVDCEARTDTFAYGLWHSSWESANAVKGWPDCEKSLVTGARVTSDHERLGCANGYTQVEPIVTACADGSTLIGLDTDEPFGVHTTAFGRVEEAFTSGEKDLDIRADSGYADALESCLAGG
jgi:hypothetical protein